LEEAKVSNLIFSLRLEKIGYRTGEAITFINSKQVHNFMAIEKLIEKEVPKLDLPKGFEKAPEYKIQSKNKKKKKWRNFKKNKR